MRLKRVLPRTKLSRFIWTTATYFLASAVLPNLLLLIVNCVGYLPYSDRPGPGWQPAHWPGKEEIGFFVGFALYMGLPTILYGTAHAVLGLIYSVSSLPKWLVRLLGGFTGLLSAGLLMEGAGWMIAISALGVYLAAGCGLVWGIFVLPQFVVKNERNFPLVVRIALPFLCVGGGVFLLISPLLPKKPVPGISFEVNRVTPGQSDIHGDDTAYFDSATWRELDDLHLHGEMHGGIQTMQSGEGKSIDVMVVALQPIDKEYTIAVPASGHVVYVLDGGKLIPHPALVAKDSRVVVIRPGNNQQFEGGQLKFSSANEYSPFTWYPTIKR